MAKHKQQHLVQFSGGATSYVAAKRVVELYGVDDTLLITANTQSEAEDWKVFVKAVSKKLKVQCVILTKGLDIWELAYEHKMIPNQFRGFCSRILKKELIDAYINVACREDAILYYGFDWLEEHRLERVRERVYPRQAEAPLMWPPAVEHGEAIEMIKEDGLPMPMAYELGLPHNNCLKYGCVKGGHAYWKQILEKLPDVYALSEHKENELRKIIGNYAIMKKTEGGVTRALSLTEFRESLEAAEAFRKEEFEWFDDEDFGPCGCFTEEDEQVEISSPRLRK